MFIRKKTERRNLIFGKNLAIKREARKVDVAIGKFGSRSFFRLNGESIEIKDYKISSSMHGSTELEVVFEFEGDFTEFLSKVNSTDGKS